MPQGNYDHPSYLTRQYDFLGRTTAGTNSLQTLLYATYPNNIRVRNVSALVGTAGTATTNVVKVLCIGTCTTFSAAGVGTQGTGTTSLGQCVLSTSTAGVVATSGDCNATINAGSILALQTGADGTGVANVTVEFHTDPLATWLGQF